MATLKENFYKNHGLAVNPLMEMPGDSYSKTVFEPGRDMSPERFDAAERSKARTQTMKTLGDVIKKLPPAEKQEFKRLLGTARRLELEANDAKHAVLDYLGNFTGDIGFSFDSLNSYKA